MLSQHSSGPVPNRSLLIERSSFGVASVPRRGQKTAVALAASLPRFLRFARAGTVSKPRLLPGSLGLTARRGQSDEHSAVAYLALDQGTRASGERVQIKKAALAAVR